MSPNLVKFHQPEVAEGKGRPPAWIPMCLVRLPEPLLLGSVNLSMWSPLSEPQSFYLESAVWTRQNCRDLSPDDGWHRGSSGWIPGPSEL